MFFKMLYLCVLERIADAEVETEGIEGRGYVEIRVDGLRFVHLPVLGVSVGLIGGMDGDTEIQAYDESVEVESQSGTGT